MRFTREAAIATTLIAGRCSRRAQLGCSGGCCDYDDLPRARRPATDNRHRKPSRQIGTRRSTRAPSVNIEFGDADPGPVALVDRYRLDPPFASKRADPHPSPESCEGTESTAGSRTRC